MAFEPMQPVQNGDAVTETNFNKIVDIYNQTGKLINTPIDNSEADNVGVPSLEITPDENLKAKNLKGISGDNVDRVNSEEKVGNFVNCENTLDGAKSNFELESENLLLFPYDDIDGRVDNGITYTINSDGSVTLNGTATGNSSFTFSYDKQILLAGTYTFSCKNSTNEIRFAIRVKNSPVLYITGTPKTAILNSSYTFNQINIAVLSGTVCNNVTVYPKIQYGEIATEYTPYVSAGTQAEITACGKNILNWKLTGGDYNSISFIQNENKTITANGTATEREYVYILAGNTELPKGNYKFKCCPRGGSSSSTYNAHIDLYKNGTFVRGYDDIGNGVEFVINDDVNQINGYIQIFKGVTVNNIVFAPILIIDGNNKTDETYEPYESQTYTSQVGQTVDILQYDKITNIFSNTAGVSIKGKFALSTQYELNNKPVSLSGAFANRPTGTYPYVVIYTATDKQDDSRTTRLEANTDGSVSDNWIKICNTDEIKKDVSLLNSDIVTSETQTGAFINGQNTLKDVMASVEVQSENLVDWKYDYTDNSGITATVNEDKSVTINGTATGGDWYYYFKTANNFKSGKYIITSCPSGGSTSTYMFNIGVYNNVQPPTYITGYNDIGNGVAIELDESILLSCGIRVREGVTVENLTFKPKLQYGTVATPYTPYLPAGTAVNITACGKNLFNVEGGISRGNYTDSMVFENGKITSSFVGSGGTSYVIFSKIYPAGTYIFSAKYNNEKPEIANDQLLSLMATVDVDGFDYNQYYNAYTYVDYSKLGYIRVNSTKSFSLGLAFRNTNEIDGNIGVYSDIMLERADLVSDYSLYQGKEYSSQVGKTVDVEQYDGITNIFSTTDGGAVSTKFLLSTKYELEDKVNLLVGTFANRPTTTQKYGLIYIATDKTGADRVTYLPPNTDGSTSGKWISFNA